MAFPFHEQETKYTCGAASMRMALEACGIKKSEKRIAGLLSTNKVRGTWTITFPVVAKRFKLAYSVERDSSIGRIKYFLRKGYVVIVLFFYPKEKVDHYSVIRKVDSKYVYFFDPFFGPEHKYSLNYFKKVWRSDYRFEKEKAWLIAIKK